MKTVTINDASEFLPMIQENMGYTPRDTFVVIPLGSAGGMPWAAIGAEIDIDIPMMDIWNGSRIAVVQYGDLRLIGFGQRLLDRLSGAEVTDWVHQPNPVPTKQYPTRAQQARNKAWVLEREQAYDLAKEIVSL